jgi:hypothetical protein
MTSVMIRYTCGIESICSLRQYIVKEREEGLDTSNSQKHSLEGYDWNVYVGIGRSAYGF